MGEIAEASDALARAGGVFDDHGIVGVAGFGEQSADAIEVTADLDDGGGGRGVEFGAKLIIGERRG